MAAGEIYDSNRYTLYGMLTRLELRRRSTWASCPTCRRRSSARSPTRRPTADVVITSGGVSVGEADYVKQLLDKLGEVLFWKIAMKPGRPLAYGQHRRRAFLRAAGQSGGGDGDVLRVRPRRAACVLQGQRDVAPLPTFKVTLGAPIRKAPGRTEFQRGILAPDGDGGCTVRTTGDQGSGILSSMSQANCFIVLPAPRPATVAAGELVDVQLLEGLI